MILADMVHAPVMAAIHAACFPPAEAWGAAAIAGQLVLPGVFGALEAEGGMILARATLDEAEILTFAVMPGIRRRGVGAALLRAAMREAGRRGAMTMWLDVAEGNRAARALYERLGFVTIARRRAYYGREDALVMRRSLACALSGARSAGADRLDPPPGAG